MSKVNRTTLKKDQKGFLEWMMEKHPVILFQENMKTIVKRGWYKDNQIQGLTIIRGHYVADYLKWKESFLKDPVLDPNTGQYIFRPNN